jgi:two-component system nitrogen regulation response regulator GlnG
MPTLLIVDDESSIRYAMEKGLRAQGLRILTTETAQAGIDAVGYHRPDVVVCDIRLPDMSGLDAFQKMREIDPHLPVIIITAHATTDTAIEAMKRGAFDYILKPYDLNELKDAVLKAIELSRISRVLADFDQSTDKDAGDPKVDHIIGKSRAMQQVYKEIGRVAPQNVNVLILGESGTGKELVARAIYQHSSRSLKPFLAINCSAIPETLLESELFGHEKGAFTNADRRRIGKFEQADKGTLFLDEIGDMSLGAQAKVLRILQDGHFERVGGNETLHCDVRIIAATNNNLEQSILKKTFREDLFYRLNTFSIHLPPLRERLEDLPRLVEYFSQRFGHDLGRPNLRISPECIASLSEHNWPGNVRELQSAIKYAIVRSTSEIVTPDCLPTSVRPGTAFVTQPSTSEPSQDSASFGDLRALIRQLLEAKPSELNDAIHTEVDRVLYEEVLRHVGGHMTQATEILGISRTTFRSRLQQLGLSIGKTLKTVDD